MPPTKIDAGEDGDETLAKMGTSKASESIAEPDEEIKAQHSNGASDSSSGNNAEEEILEDGLIAQLLARVDKEEYQKAVDKDAKSIAENFIIPLNMPWHTRQRLPKRFLKTLPRDIDDLHAITHCEDELHSPFGDMTGAFGFGRFENGQARGHYNGPGRHTHFDLLSPDSAKNSFAAARRSDDPGVIELNVSLPLPPSIKAVRKDKPQSNMSLTVAEKWKATLFSNPNNLETFSRLPYHWEKKDGPLLQKNSGIEAAFKQIDQHSIPKDGAKDNRKYTFGNGSRIQHLSPRNSMSDQKIFALLMMRKWKVSVKVHNVSSRSAVFPEPVEIANDNNVTLDKNKRRVIRPMLRTATLPLSVQTGVTVTTDMAAELDDDGFAYKLGSYDCRFTDKILTPKKESSNRSRRIEVGRTRIVWSSLIQGDEPFLPSTRNRINFNSLITGQRLDATKCKRPREVRVGVRLNGKLIIEEAVEDMTVSESKVRKRKHSTRQAENEVLSSKPSIQHPSPRTIHEINAAFRLIIPDSEQSNERSTKKARMEMGNPVLYYDLGSNPPSLPDFDKKKHVASLLKFNQKKKTKRSSISNNALANKSVGDSRESALVVTDVHKARKFTHPRFACFPLEDGLLRTVCMAPGNMAVTDISKMFSEVLRDDLKCSVCWTSEGSGEDSVQKCVDCGLLAHISCCRDKGMFSGTLKNDVIKAEDNLGRTIKGWRCAVCSDKTSTNSNSGSGILSDHAKRECFDSTNEILNVSGPSCAFCLHIGGAMSVLEERSNGRRWVHEVCRVWAGMKSPSMPKGQQLEQTPSLCDICVLCGKTGGLAFDGHPTKCGTGLVRCAARGCFVAFHPMCGLLSTKLNSSDQDVGKSSAKHRSSRKASEAFEGKNLQREGDVVAEDKKLCNQYTFQLVRVKRPVIEEDSNDKISLVLPIAYCGIHNPLRDESFYGFLPSGDMMN